ncbi:MAG: lanthionine synthetase LanC family protein [Porphyromonas sp.]|nr:lanthionine synthetase LanC family protein [Porphyromonas sp.]
MKNSLHEGMGSYLFLNYYIGKLLHDDSLVNFSSIIFEQSLLNTIQGQITNLHSFADGLPGICWMLSYYSRLRGDSFEIDENVDAAIIYAAKHAFRSQNPDLLYGGMGGLFYLSQKSNIISLNELFNIAKDYIEICLKDSKGARCKNSILRYQKNKEFDIGYAHGLSGFVSVLATLTPLNNEEINNIIKLNLKYIEEQFRTGYKSYYPATVIEDRPPTQKEIKDKYNIRLGWCYGDLAIATMYLTLFVKSNKKEYYEKSISLARATLVRRERIDTHINDIFFCHGSSYLTYIYYKFYQYTKDPFFLEASQFWRNDVVANLEQALKGNDLVSFLNSISGAIFVLLYIDEGIIHDDFFQAYLLNI